MATGRSRSTSFFKFIQKFDVLFGQRSFWYIQNREAQTSAFSGFLTIILILLLSAIGINYCIQMTQRKVSVVTLSSQEAPNEDIYLDPSKFIFAIGLKKLNYSQTIGILNISIIYKNYIYGKLASSQTYPLTACTYAYFNQTPFADLPNVYNYFALGTQACPPMNTSYTISGQYNSAVFNFLQIVAIPCQNITGNQVVCQNQSVIDSFLANNGGEPLQMQLFYTDNIIDVSNFYSPYTSNIISNRWYVPAKQSNIADMYISKYNITSTMSWIPYFGNVSNATYRIEKQNIQNLFYTNSSGPLLQITLRMNDEMYEYYRSYSTLIDTLSKIGGIFTILAAGFGFLARTYNLYKMKVTIANSVYQIYNDSDNIKRKSTENIEMTAKGSDTQPRESFTTDKDISTTLQLSNSKDVLTRLQESFVKKLAGSKIRSSFNSFIKFMCGTCSKKKSEDTIIFKQVEEKLRYDIDIIEVVKKIQQFEKFKELMLTKPQKEVFNFTPKPKIYSTLKAHKQKEELDITAGFLNYKKNHYHNLSALVRLQAAYAELEKETDARSARINEEMISMMGKDMQANLKRLGKVIAKNPELLEGLEQFEQENKERAASSDEGSGDEFSDDEYEHERKILKLNEKSEPKSRDANGGYTIDLSSRPIEADNNTSRTPIRAELSEDRVDTINSADNKIL